MKRRNDTYNECSELVACIFGIVEIFLSDSTRLGVEEAEFYVLDVVFLGHDSCLVASIALIVHDAVRLVPFACEEAPGGIAEVVILDSS